MQFELDLIELERLGLSKEEADQLLKKISIEIKPDMTPDAAWQVLSQTLLHPYPFPVHLFFFSLLFPLWQDHPDKAPAWVPPLDLMTSANIAKAMAHFKLADVKSFHRFSVEQYEAFWVYVIKELNIVFKQNPKAICDLSQGLKSPNWLPQAKLNIAESCFTADKNRTALIYEKDGKLLTLTYDELNRLSNRIANSLVALGLKPGDAIGIAMPMDHFAVAAYLGIIKMGVVVVSIADSFSREEIHLRLRIAKAKSLITQYELNWGGKTLPLYKKIRNEQDKLDFKIIVLPADDRAMPPLFAPDIAWHAFLSSNEVFNAVACDPVEACNILFSSGTTGDPKAIVWNHTTPLKAGSDAYFHHNIKPDSILTWPTNLGWMMGPWLIFAAFLNQAAVALYPDAPKDRRFGEFVERAKVTMLGVVPTLVATWRQSRCMEGLGWHAIHCFSSTGECSNAEDMLYLMSLAGYKPIIEYCGGTEIGGAYVSSTLVQNNYPALFSTPTMGLNFVIVNEEGKEAPLGEVAIIPPALGLSTILLNAKHDEVYFANMPTLPDGTILRRHGDQIKQFPNGYYAVLGRVDDTMNLGGIKISAAEIERAIAGLPDILEVAAISVPPPDNGPHQLVIYAATLTTAIDKQECLKAMQGRVNQHLNPLFKIADVIFTKDLPKTASNKIMRRKLRKAYQEKIFD